MPLFCVTHLDTLQSTIFQPRDIRLRPYSGFDGPESLDLSLLHSFIEQDLGYCPGTDRLLWNAPGIFAPVIVEHNRHWRAAIAEMLAVKATLQFYVWPRKVLPFTFTFDWV